VDYGVLLMESTRTGPRSVEGVIRVEINLKEKISRKVL
jgi:hypothetical protein